jgi:DNA-binding HxlR family transcriptional regulator
VGRSYNQHCALAHAMDLVGERWTLLIVRELLAGPRRYTDLAAGLVTVPTNLLSDRLKRMESDGVVQRRPLPPPADSVTVYELTELGRGLAEPLAALTRWGLRTLPAAREERTFRPHWLVLGLRAHFDPAAAAGVREAYEFRIGDDVVHFEVDDGDGTPGLGPATEPTVVVEADADTFLALATGAIEPPEAIERGARIEGDPAALKRMGAILPPA